MQVRESVKINNEVLKKPMATFIKKLKDDKISGNFNKIFLILSRATPLCRSNLQTNCTASSPAWKSPSTVMMIVR